VGPISFHTGNEGPSRELRRVCRIDSAIAQAMVKRNLALAREIRHSADWDHRPRLRRYVCPFGFSGVSSNVNHVVINSFDFDQTPEEKARLVKHHESFFEQHVLAQAPISCPAWGTPAVRPFLIGPTLRWRFNYAADGSDSGWRDNPTTFLLASRKLHGMFGEFNLITQGDYADNATQVDFDSIEPAVREILSTVDETEGRARAWNAECLPASCIRIRGQSQSAIRRRQVLAIFRSCPL